MSGSPDKAQWSISSQRLVKTFAIQTENLVPVFCNFTMQTNIPDDNTVFVEPVELFLHIEMD